MHKLPFNLEFKYHNQKLPSLNTIEQKLLSVFRIIIILSLLSIIFFFVIYIICQDDSYTVQPFKTMGMGDTVDGNALATLLNFDLQYIKNIYDDTGQNIQQSSTNAVTLSRPLSDFFMPSPLSMNPQLDYSLSQIGTIGTEGVSISIGSVLSSMKEFLNHGPNTITCSLQRYNSSIILVAILEDHKHNRLITLENDSPEFNNEQIPFLIQDLAYKISFALCKQSNNASQCEKNWQTFKYVTQGRDAYNNYMLTKNIKYLNKSYNMSLSALEFEPNFKGTNDLLYSIGLCYINQSSSDRNFSSKAEQSFLDISKSKPFESWFGLGLVYGYRNGSDTKALNAFDKATKLKPNDINAWVNKGLILDNMQNYPEAREAFNNAIGLYAKADPKVAMIWYLKGNAFYMEHNYEEAIIAYKKAIELSPRYADAWYYEANAFYIEQHYEKAIIAYENAIELNNKTSTWYYNKGLALVELGDREHNNSRLYEEAIQSFNQAIKLTPQYDKAKNEKNSTLTKLCSSEHYNRPCEELKTA